MNLKQSSLQKSQWIPVISEAITFVSVNLLCVHNEQGQAATSTPRRLSKLPRGPENSFNLAGSFWWPFFGPGDLWASKWQIVCDLQTEGIKKVTTLESPRMGTFVTFCFPRNWLGLLLPVTIPGNYARLLAPADVASRHKTVLAPPFRLKLSLEGGTCQDKVTGQNPASGIVEMPVPQCL